MARVTAEWVAKHDDQAIPPRVKDRVLRAFGGRCAKTGHEFRAGDPVEFDHIVALVNGGEHRESNLQPLMGEAHKEKSLADLRVKSKVARVRKKLFGLTRPRNIVPGSKASKFKKHLDGSVSIRAGR